MCIRDSDATSVHQAALSALADRFSAINTTVEVLAKNVVGYDSPQTAESPER